MRCETENTRHYWMGAQEKPRLPGIYDIFMYGDSRHGDLARIEEAVLEIAFALIDSFGVD